MIKVRAFAKINLSLRVLGVRDDGYHELRTVFQSIALHDTLTIRVRRGPFALQCDDPVCPADRTNLVWRAGERVWAASGRRGPLRDLAIHLAKRIPLQAGLGGGSSDAAATLHGLGSLWRVDEARLREIARALGADVPYFLEGGTVLGLDRGELLFPLLDHPSAWVTLVIPDFGVSTQDAFGWWDTCRGRSALDARQSPLHGASASAREGARLRGLIDELGNDLQAPVTARHPEIGRIVAALERAGAAYAAMSGSGSAVFGLFDRRDAAERVARVLSMGKRGLVSPARRRPRNIFVTRIVNRAAYQRLAATRDSAR